MRHPISKQISFSRWFLIKLLLSKYPNEINEENCGAYFECFLEPGFELEADNSQKLLELFLDITIGTQNKDVMILIMLEKLVADEKPKISKLKAFSTNLIVGILT